MREMGDLQIQTSGQAKTWCSHCNLDPWRNSADKLVKGNCLQRFQPGMWIPDVKRHPAKSHFTWKWTFSNATWPPNKTFSLGLHLSENTNIQKQKSVLISSIMETKDFVKSRILRVDELKSQKKVQRSYKSGFIRLDINKLEGIFLKKKRLMALNMSFPLFLSLVYSFSNTMLAILTAVPAIFLITHINQMVYIFHYNQSSLINTFISILIWPKIC